MSTGSVEDRLAALQQHVDYPQAMRHAPRSSTAVIAALGIALTGGGGVIGVVAPTAVVRTVGWCLSLAGVTCLAVAVFFAATPLERVLAMVASERIPTDRRDGATGRRHYITLERLDGIKREYRASRELIDRLAEGDAGVAYLKAGFLLDFRHLR